MLFVCTNIFVARRHTGSQMECKFVLSAVTRPMCLFECVDITHHVFDQLCVRHSLTQVSSGQSAVTRKLLGLSCCELCLQRESNTHAVVE